MKPYLEIGNLGRSLGDDWETLDDHQAPNTDIVHDIAVFPYPIPDNRYEIVHFSHVLEHLPWWQTVDILKELHRILKIGGVVEIHVPDMEKIYDAYRNDVILDDWYTGNPEKVPGLWWNGRILRGPIDKEEPENYWHRAFFDEKHLTWCLKKAGFTDVKRIGKPRGHDHGVINLGMSGTKL